MQRKPKHTEVALEAISLYRQGEVNRAHSKWNEAKILYLQYLQTK